MLAGVQRAGRRLPTVLSMWRRAGLSTAASRVLTDERGAPMTVDITAAAEEVLGKTGRGKDQRLVEVAGHDGSFLRVAVDSGGCHGFQYKLSLEREMRPDDVYVRQAARCRACVDCSSGGARG